MKSSFSRGEVQNRLYNSQSADQPARTSISTVEQGILDRWHFEMHSKVMASDSTPLESEVFTNDNAATMIDEVTKKLGWGYQWFGETDPNTMRRLVNEVIAFKAQHLAEFGEEASDIRIYREYRLRIEQAEVADEYDHEATLLLDILISQRDIVNEQLPLFTSSK